MAVLSIILLSPVCVAQGTGGPKVGGMVTLTIRASATGTFKSTDPTVVYDDQITVTFTETDVFKILTWEQGKQANLKQVSCVSHAAVEGKAKLAFPGLPTPIGDYTNPSSWTYVCKVPPDVSKSGVVLVPEADGVHGFISTEAIIGWNNGWVHWVPEAPNPGGGGYDAIESAAKSAGLPKVGSFVLPTKVTQQNGHLAGQGTSNSALGASGKGTGHIEVSYDLFFGVPPKQKPEVALDEVDRQWLPEDKNSVNATVHVTGDKDADAFRFTLYDVSKEPGTCCNSEDSKTDPDLSFALGQDGWDVQQSGDGWVATKGKSGKSATIEISSHDWGAWGRLKAEAKIDGQWQPAKVAGTGYDYVRIPYDQDDDHIADFWQEQNGVGGKSAKDDSGKKPTDQANDGDGLSIYEDYRGFMVNDSGVVRHVRLDPGQKVLFALDNSGYFKTDRWQQCSGIKAYLLDPTMCQQGSTPDGARKVNFRSSYAKNGDKFCVVLARGDAKKGSNVLGETEGKDGPIQAPRDVAYCRVFPAVADD
jgi:hypothetical protein